MPSLFSAAELHRLSMTIGLSSSGVQLGVQEAEGKDREEQVEVDRERRVKEVRHGWYGDGCEKTQDLSQ